MSAHLSAPPVPSPAAQTLPAPTTRRRRIQLLQNRALGVAVFLILLALFFSALAPNFANIGNLNTIALNAAILVVVACAQAMVVITRNYDLSVGSTVALASYVGLDIVRQFPEAGPALILVPVALGTLCGVVNGALVAYGRLPSVVATLGTMSIFRGLAFLYANGGQINGKDLPAWVAGTATSHVFGLSTLILVACIVVALASFMLNKLRIGREIYAIGSNPEAAVFYGLDARAVIFRAYVMAGLLTGLAAYLFAARASWIVPYLAQGLELTTLAAVVVGGVSVLGGSGTILGAALGAVTLATLDNGLVLLGSSEFIRQFIQGAAIIIAVVIDAVIQRRIRDLLKTMRSRRS
jgi:rhamnose transport system permease protein